MNVPHDSRLRARPVPGHANALRTGLIAGLVTGAAGLIPVLILQKARGVGVIPEMQLAASSVMGLPAYDGAPGFFIGTALHFLVSVVPAIIFALAVARLPVLNRMPWLAGPAFGFGVFLVMGLIILPHSRFAVPAGVTSMPPLAALLVHLFLFGLPIALIVRHLSKDEPVGG